MKEANQKGHYADDNQYCPEHGQQYTMHSILVMLERPMPYYVYAIHQDDTNNRHYNAKPFHSWLEAEAFEREMRDASVPRDNYIVTTIAAETDAEAEAKADAMRPFPKMQTKR